MLYDESKTPPIQYITNINGTCMLLDTILNVKRNQFKEQYKMQFLSCSCKDMDRNDRKRLMNRQRQKQNYDQMEPSKKKILLEKAQSRYNVNKQDVARKYKTMDSDKKRKLLDKQTEKIKHNIK